MIHISVGDKVHDLIQKTIDRALCATFGWSVPKKYKVKPGIWCIVCGFLTAPALQRKLMLEMAARLKVSENRAGRIFRNLYGLDRGSFEIGVHIALKEWLLLGQWDSLSKDTLIKFQRKVLKVSRKCWPTNVQTNGNVTWLYHNHIAFSGNVPMWADWDWPKGKNFDVFRVHYYCLLIGQHSAGGRNARCSNLLCKDSNVGPIYDHHYFKCVEYSQNCSFFRKAVNRMYNEYVGAGCCDISRVIIDGILEQPCKMWVGLFDDRLFDLGLKLQGAHELHRIVTMASVLSWGRFYALP